MTISAPNGNDDDSLIWRNNTHRLSPMQACRIHNRSNQAIDKISNESSQSKQN